MYMYSLFSFYILIDFEGLERFTFKACFDSYSSGDSSNHTSSPSSPVESTSTYTWLSPSVTSTGAPPVLQRTLITHTIH